MSVEFIGLFPGTTASVITLNVDCYPQSNHNNEINSTYEHYSTITYYGSSDGLGRFYHNYRTRKLRSLLKLYKGYIYVSRKFGICKSMTLFYFRPVLPGLYTTYQKHSYPIKWLGSVCISLYLVSNTINF